MKIQFARPDLHQLDRVTAETFVVNLFEEDRPPRGVAGLVDWRLCGRLSRMIAGGQLRGEFREAVLFPGYGRLPAGRICAYGLGRTAEFTPARAREAAWFIADSLHKLRVNSFATALPGSPTSPVPVRARMELFLEEVTRVFGAEEGIEVTIVEPADTHRDLAEVVGNASRRLRGLWK